MNLAPIVLFTYKRVDVLKQSVAALQANYLAENSDLFIFSDAAKQDVDEEVVLAVRAYLKTIVGFKTVTIFEASNNKGLANSIIDGVTKVIAQYGRIIVLEDDLKTTPNFLTYMNHSLSRYDDRERVFSVSGYNYNFNIPVDYNYDNYFSSRGCSWGWATWNNRWEKIDWNINNYGEIDSKSFRNSFNRSGSDLSQMLIKQREGIIDSWAIRWYYNQWKLGGITSYPVLSLIDNNGFDDNATHTKVFNRYKTTFMSSEKTNFVFSNEIDETSFYQKKIQSKFSVLNRIFWGRGMTILKNIGIIGNR